MGTIVTGVWQGTAIADTYVANDITLTNITQITTRSHTSLTDIGSNAHSVIDTHIGDGTKHFLEGAIDHVNILNIGSNAHSVIDTHIGAANPHSGSAPSAHSHLDAEVDNGITLTNITQITTRSHTSLSDIGTNAHSVIDTHIAAANPHSGSAPSAHSHLDAEVDNGITLTNITQITTRSHTSLSDIGTNAHSVIDTHLAASTKHYLMLDEDDMVSDDNTKAATQQSIKKYVDDEIGGIAAGDTIDNYFVPIISSTGSAVGAGGISALSLAYLGYANGFIIVPKTGTAEVKILVATAGTGDATWEWDYWYNQGTYDYVHGAAWDDTDTTSTYNMGTTQKYYRFSVPNVGAKAVTKGQMIGVRIQNKENRTAYLCGFELCYS